MTDLSRFSLEELCRRAREIHGRRSLQRLVRSLEGDPRAGALALAELCRRRLAKEGKERRRVSSLFHLRRRLQREGAQLVAGVDEVGMGPLAGPVVAAAVILPEKVELPGLDDSKRVPREARDRLAEAIRAQAVAFAIGEVPPDEVDRLNVYRAGLEAMRRAVVALSPPPDHVFTDARRIPEIDWPQTPLVKGDSREGSVAAASIIAKVHRDRIMVRLHEEFPDYGFASHKGYATALHLAALRRLGPTPAHRRSFTPVSQLALF